MDGDSVSRGLTGGVTGRSQGGGERAEAVNWLRVVSKQQEAGVF